jgi:hypothetical protein
MQIEHHWAKVHIETAKVMRKPRENSSLAKNPLKYTTAYKVQ